MLMPQERRALLLLVGVFAVVAAGAALLEYLGSGAFATPFSPTLPDGTLASVRGPVEDVVAANGGHLICRIGGVRVFVPASAVPEPAPQAGELLECYGIVSTYEGAKELAVRDARDLVRVDQE
ncbi:MAG: hypothetical protein ABFC89_01035 [Methanospirillum sp.]